MVTQYYSELYINHTLEYIENFAKPSRYDLVIMLTPDVDWVDDGMRLNGDPQKRWQLHYHLKSMYEQRGFKVTEIGGTYIQRMETAIKTVNEFMNNIYPQRPDTKEEQ